MQQDADCLRSCLLNFSYQASNWPSRRGGCVRMTSAPASTCAIIVIMFANMKSITLNLSCLDRIDRESLW